MRDCSYVASGTVNQNKPFFSLSYFWSWHFVKAMRKKLMQRWMWAYSGWPCYGCVKNPWDSPGTREWLSVTMWVLRMNRLLWNNSELFELLDHLSTHTPPLLCTSPLSGGSIWDTLLSLCFVVDRPSSADASWQVYWIEEHFLPSFPALTDVLELVYSISRVVLTG